MSRMLTFNRALWVGTLGVIVWLLTWPLVMNMWAGSHWKQTECRISAGDGYLFVVDDKVWVSERRDFWQAGKQANRGASAHISTPDSACWVNPTDPREAVHFLDAPRNWSNATGRLVGSGMLIVVAGGLTLVDARRRRVADKGKQT